MNRAAVLLAYRVLGPLALLGGAAVGLERLGLADFSEGAIPEALYMAMVLLTFGLALALPFLALGALIVAATFRSDWRLMAPALLMLVFAAGVAASAFGPRAASNTALGASQAAFFLFGLTATRVGWSARRMR